MKDSILRLCLLAYPRSSRERDGRAILDLARELSSRSSLSFIRETGGLVAGGVRARGRLMRLDVTGAPWRAALEGLALPVAVAMLCLVVAFVAPHLLRAHWVGWWPSLALAATLTTVYGAASARRGFALAGSFALLCLMVADAIVSLGTNNSRWSGGVGMGDVDVFAMWLPVAVLLLICAGAVGTTRTGRRRGAAWVVCIPVAITILLAACSSMWVTRMSLGGVFVYGPLAAVPATMVWGAVRRDLAIRTMAALLIAGSCFPILWLFAYIVPYPPALVPWFPILYFGAGWLVAGIAIRLLLRSPSQAAPSH